MGRAPKAPKERKKPTGLKPFKCKYKGCSNAYKSSSGLTNHVNGFHLGVKFRCERPNYGKDFAQKGGLDAHVKSAHDNIRHLCVEMGCTKSFTTARALRRHVDSFHHGKSFPCPVDGCSIEYAYESNLEDHIKSAHQGEPFPCHYDDCDRVFTTRTGRSEHIQTIHNGRTLVCPFNDRDKIFTSRSGRSEHVRSIHQGIRHVCLFDDCDHVYARSSSLSDHIRSAHTGIHEDAAEIRKKKDLIRQALAEKETQGICSATIKCQNPTINGSFCYQLHEKTVDCVAKAIKEKSEAGRLPLGSIQTPDEFSILLQREKTYLNPEVVETLQMLKHGLDDVHTAARSYVMDTEFCWAGEYVAMDITIQRLQDGKEVISTRVDLDTDIEELQARCSSLIPKQSVRKVYGRSDRT